MTSSLGIRVRAPLLASEILSFCPLQASANQPVLAVFSRSRARVELYLLLTVHSFTPYFRKEVNARLWDIHRLFIGSFNDQVLRRNNWTPNTAGLSPGFLCLSGLVHGSARPRLECFTSSSEEELAVTQLRCWLQNWIRLRLLCVLNSNQMSQEKHSALLMRTARYDWRFTWPCFWLQNVRP